MLLFRSVTMQNLSPIGGPRGATAIEDQATGGRLNGAPLALGSRDVGLFTIRDGEMRGHERQDHL